MQNKSTPVFSPSQAALGSIFGGPLAATYFIRHNFKALGQERGAQKVLHIGSFIVIVVLCLMPMLPKEFPTILISLPVIIFTRYFIEKKQFTKQQVVDHQTLEFQPVVRVVIASLACFLINMALIFSLALLLAFTVPA